MLILIEFAAPSGVISVSNTLSASVQVKIRSFWDELPVGVYINGYKSLVKSLFTRVGREYDKPSREIL